MAHFDPGLVETFEGIEITDGYGVVRQVLRTGVRELDAEVRGEIERLYEIARASLSAVWPAVEVLVNALLKHEELDREAIDEVLGGLEVFRPVLAVQRSYGLLTMPVGSDVPLRVDRHRSS